MYVLSDAADSARRGIIWGVFVYGTPEGGNRMDYSTRISERMWNLPDKGEREAEREQTFIDDIVQKSHIEHELLDHLDGIRTVFDGGAGCGRFSILLARQGLQVTHFDISRQGFSPAGFSVLDKPPVYGIFRAVCV